jgi:hypothetical protein
MSQAGSSDPIVGFDARSLPGPGSLATVAGPMPVLGDITPGSEAIAPAAAATPVVTGVPGEALHALHILAASWDGGAPEQARAELLDGALDGDWEGVEGDLRRFLARLDGLADAQDGSGAGPTWPAWIAAMTALLVARQASPGRRRRAGRLVPALALASARRPTPVGPWPLGPP